jgi:hypothetical protein
MECTRSPARPRAGCNASFSLRLMPRPEPAGGFPAEAQKRAMAQKYPFALLLLLLIKRTIYIIRVRAAVVAAFIGEKVSIGGAFFSILKEALNACLYRELIRGRNQSPACYCSFSHANPISIIPFELPPKMVYFASHPHESHLLSRQSGETETRKCNCSHGHYFLS